MTRDIESRKLIYRVKEREREGRHESLLWQPEQHTRYTDPPLHRRHVGPIETGTGEQHVSDEGLDRRFADQPDEEELLDDLGRHGAQRRQPQEQFSETHRLIGVLRPAVLFKGALRFLLQTLDVRNIRQPASICWDEKNNISYISDDLIAERGHFEFQWILLTVNEKSGQPWTPQTKRGNRKPSFCAGQKKKRICGPWVYLRELMPLLYDTLFNNQQPYRLYICTVSPPDFSRWNCIFLPHSFFWFTSPRWEAPSVVACDVLCTTSVAVPRPFVRRPKGREKNRKIGPISIPITDANGRMAALFLLLLPNQDYVV